MVLLRITAGALTMKQSPQGDPRPRGLYVGRDGFDGWDDGATVRAATLARPQAHGDFDMPGYLAGRLVPLSGFAFADSPFDLDRLRDRFIGHGSDGAKFRVTVERAGRELWADARLAAGQKPTFVDTGRGRRATWATSWWFPDPRKYGAPNVFGPASSVTVLHYGNFPALPVLTITGSPGTGYTVYGPGGRQIIVTAALAGVPHRIEMATGRLYVGSSRVIGGLARADLWSIPPGVPGTPVSVSAGAVTVEVPDTYV